MLWALAIVGIYLGGMACFALWDAYIGFGVEFDGGTWPPMGLALGIWPIVLPFAIGAKLMSGLDSVKEARIAKEFTQKRLRIAAQKEQEEILQQVEEEMSHVEDEGKKSTPYARIVGTSSSRYE
jgi:hypothetical protein